MVRDNYITYEQFETKGKWKLLRVKYYNFDKYFDHNDSEEIINDIILTEFKAMTTKTNV